MLSLRRHITAHVLKVVTRGVATDPLPVAQACIRREVRRRHIHLRNIPCVHPGGKKKGKEKEEKAGSRRKPSPHVLPPLSRATLCRGGGLSRLLLDLLPRSKSEGGVPARAPEPAGRAVVAAVWRSQLVPIPLFPSSPLPPSLLLLYWKKATGTPKIFERLNAQAMP